MIECVYRMLPYHEWSRVSHDVLNVGFHLFLIAVCWTTATRALIVSVNAPFESFMRVGF